MKVGIAADAGCVRFQQHTDKSACAGELVYHGPCDQVMGFFRTKGFDLPERKGIPDFLQEVTGRSDQQV